MWFCGKPSVTAELQYSTRLWQALQFILTNMSWKSGNHCILCQRASVSYFKGVTHICIFFGCIKSKERMCSLLGRHITGIYADLYCVHIHSLAATSCQQHVFTAAQNMNRIRVSLYPDMAAVRSIAASENKDVREYCLQHAVPLLHKGLLNFSNQELDFFFFFFLKVALKVLSMSDLI